MDQVLASQIKAVEETLWAKLTPLQVSHYSPISYTQFTIRSVQQDSPVSKQFSHSFLCFLVDKVLASQIEAEEETLWAKLTPCRSLISYTQFKIRSAQQDSPVSKTVFTLLFVFWWTKSWHPRSRLRKRLYGWSWLQSRSAVSHPSLIHSSRAIQCSKTVQFQKQFSLSSLCFLVDQVLASQIKAEKETLWMKLTPKQVSC